jgi:hypothetical protein
LQSHCSIHIWNRNIVLRSVNALWSYNIKYLGDVVHYHSYIIQHKKNQLQKQCFSDHGLYTINVHIKIVLYIRIYWAITSENKWMHFNLCKEKTHNNVFNILFLLFSLSLCDYRFTLASSMDQSSSWAAKSHSASQEIPWTLFAVYLMTSDYIVLNDLRVNNALETMWKEAVVAWFY